MRILRNISKLVLISLLFVTTTSLLAQIEPTPSALEASVTTDENSSGWGTNGEEAHTPVISFTEAEKANAIVVDSFDSSERVPLSVSPVDLARAGVISTEVRQVYRLRDCEENTSDKVCYFAVQLRIDIDKSSDLEAKSDGPNYATQQCMLILKNRAGHDIVRLQENITIKYGRKSGGFARLPATALSGTLNGTYAHGLYAIWQQTTGPTVNPGWNIKVKQGGYLNAIAEGLLHTYIPIIGATTGSFVLTVILYVDSSQTGCMQLMAALEYLPIMSQNLLVLAVILGIEGITSAIFLVWRNINYREKRKREMLSDDFQ